MLCKQDFNELKIAAGIIDFYVNKDDKEEVRNLIESMRDILNEIEEYIETSE